MLEKRSERLRVVDIKTLGVLRHDGGLRARRLELIIEQLQDIFGHSWAGTGRREHDGFLGALEKWVLGHQLRGLFRGLGCHGGHTEWPTSRVARSAWLPRALGSAPSGNLLWRRPSWGLAIEREGLRGIGARRLHAWGLSWEGLIGWLHIGGDTGPRLPLRREGRGDGRGKPDIQGRRSWTLDRPEWADRVLLLLSFI
jgi:hypothetical protein